MTTLASMTVRLGIDTDRLQAGADRAKKTLTGLGKAVAALGVGVPAAAAGVVAVGGMAAAFASAGIAAKAFQLAAQPQLESVANVADLAAKAEDAAAKGGKEAAAAQKEYTDALNKLPPATRATAKEFIGLKSDFSKWSDSLSSTTMPIFTQGLKILRGLLPALTPLVKAAASAIGDFLDDIQKGVDNGSIKDFAQGLAKSAEKNLGAFLRSMKNVFIGIAGIISAFTPMSDDMSGGLEKMTAKFAAWGQSLKGSEGFAKFVALAKQGAQTLGMLGAAALRLFVAISPLIGVTSLVAMQLARLINALPPSVLKVLASAIAGVVISMKAYRAGAAVVAGASAIIQSSAVRAAAAWVASAARSTAAMVRIAASAVANAARTAAVWAASAARATATWLLTILRVAAVTVAQFLLMAARAVAWAAVMAAQWLIAMGPIGWIIAIVIALVALIIAKWDVVKSATLAAWSAVKSWVSGAVDGVLAAVGWLATIPGKVSAWFGRAKDAAVQKATSMVTWLKGLPGRAIGAISSLGGRLWNTVSAAGGRMVSAITAKANSAISKVRGLPGRARSALGGLGGTLFNAGQSLISGFIRGIASKAGALFSKARSLVSKVRGLFPFSPAKEGPFSGKGYTLYSGRALIDGFAAGIAQRQALLRKTMGDTAQLASDALPASATPRGVARAAGGREPQRLVVDVTGGSDDLIRVVRNWLKTNGHSTNVQAGLGTR
ncbi:hypothetical protein [Streptomyces sp. NPDC019937]|uniref:hypothetical protein n=1 Tax=Streptomyces sp. NPDC019937 TaxID=3154787 RepID=UPI0033D80873